MTSGQRRWFSLLIVLLLGGGRWPVFAEASKVASNPDNRGQEVAVPFVLLSPDVRAEPGRPVPIFIQIKNVSDQPVSYSPVVTLPGGWRQLDTHPFTLSPGSHRVDTILLLPPPDATAGTYRWHVDYALNPFPIPGLDTEAYMPIQGIIRVDSRPKLDVTPLDGPTAVLESPYVLRFLVQNVGNVHHRLRLDASDNVGLPLIVTPGTISLAPGEEHIVTVQTTWSHYRAGPIVHRPTLHVVDEKDPTIRGQGAARVELVPPSRSPRSAFRLFPLRATLRLDAWGDEGALSATLRGRGPVSDRVPDELTLELGRNRGFASYRRANWRITAGDHTFPSSPLTRDEGTARGIELELEPPSMNVRLFRYRTADDYTGLQVRSPLLPSLPSDLTLNVFTSPATGIPGRPIASLLGTLSPREGIHIGSEYGRRLGNPTANAFALFTTVEGELEGGTDGGFVTTTMWRRIGAGYWGETGPSEELSILYDVGVGPSRWTWHWAETWRYEGAFGSDLANRQRRLVATWRSGRTEGWQGVHYVANQSSSSGAAGKTFRRLHAHWRTTFPDGSVLRIGFGTMHTSDGMGNGQSGLPGRADFHFPLSDGRLGLYVDGDFLPTSSLQAPLRAGIRLTHRRDDLEAKVYLDVTPGASKPYRLGGRMRYALANDHRIEGELGYRWGGKTTEQKGRIGYVVPLDVALPIGRRRDIGEVRGRLIDEHGHGVPHAIVRIGEEAVRTDEGGVFRFPAIKEGEHLVVVDGQTVPANRIVLPHPQQRVEIGSGERAEVLFRIVPLAKVHAKVQALLPTPPSLDHLFSLDFTDLSSPFFPRVAEDEPVLKGLVVQLSNGTESFRRTVQNVEISTDAGNAIATAILHFDGVPPGPWSVTVPLDTIPPGYAMDRSDQVVLLQPGETRSIDLRLGPAPRELRFIDLGDPGVLRVPPEAPTD